MNKFIKIFTMFFLITFSSTLYADAPGPVNLSLKGIVDWVRFFQFVEYGTTLPSTPSTRGVWFILWVNDEPALYWSNGSEWIPFVTAGVQDGSVDTDALADGAVTTSKLSDNAVTTEKLMNSAVTTNKIADNAVTGTKFANNSITTAKLANSAVTSEKLGYLSVGTINIQNGAVTSEKIESTIQNKNLLLNDGTFSNPSLSFSSNQTSGLSYDDASNTINVSISGSEKINIGASDFNLLNLTDGLNIISENEKLNLKSDGIYKDNLSLTLNNNIVASGSIIPAIAGNYSLGTNGKEFGEVRSFMGLFTSLYLGSSGTYVGANMNMYTQNEYVFSFFNGIYPYSNRQLNLGDSNHRWKNAYFTNNYTDCLYIASNSYPITDDFVELGTNTYRFKSGNIINLNSENIISNNASFTNSDIEYLNVSNNLEVNGIASVTSLLVNGNIVSGVENLKFPRGTLSVDVDCGKYSLRSLGKDLVLFSDAFMMINYNITDDGNYFTFKSATASPAVMIMDNPVQNLSTITVRLDYENIILDSNLHHLLSIQNANGDYIAGFYNNNSKFYMSFFNGNATLIDFNEASYDWNEERNIYLTLDYSQVGYVDWTVNIDGVDVYNQKTSVSGNATGTIDINNINVGDGNNGTYSISQDFNAKYRRIQIYPYKLSLKEMISIPLLQPIVDQQRELSKNMTKCPYYTLGEPSTLIGGDFNEGEGFFGEVTGDKFIYGWEVLGQLWGMDMNVIDTKAKFIASFTDVFGSDISYTFIGDSYTELGVSDNLEVEWLKFYDHGYLIFIPKRPLLNNITWDEINNILGGYEGKEIQIPVNRINPIQTSTNKKNVGLICRMINGGNLQPIIIGNINERGLENNNLGIGSEWNRLMYRICDQIPSDIFSGVNQGYSGGKQLGDNWFNYTGSVLGFGASNDLGVITWCRDYVWSSDTLGCCACGSYIGVGFITMAFNIYQHTNRGFRPALVLKVSNQ